MSRFDTVGKRSLQDTRVLQQHGQRRATLTPLQERDENALPEPPSFRQDAPSAAAFPEGLHPAARRPHPTERRHHGHTSGFVRIPPSEAPRDERSASTPGPPTRFAVNDRDPWVSLPRVAHGVDGEAALRELAQSQAARDQVRAEVERILAKVGHNSLALNELVVMVTRTEPRELEGSILAFYDIPGMVSRRLDLAFHDAVQAAGDVRLDAHHFPLNLVDSELINAQPHKPPPPPAGMPLLMWHNSGDSTVKTVQIKPQQFNHIGHAMRYERYAAHDVLPEGYVPASGKMTLPAAFGAVLDLVVDHIGVHPSVPLARSHPGVTWQRELVTIRSQVEKDLRAGEDVAISDPLIGTNPLHYFGRLCWTWTGEAYAIFELIASGEYLVELRALRTSSGAAVDFGRLCGLPIYTNTPFDTPISDHELPRLHFRILGTIQGGNEHTVFVTPLDFLHRALLQTLRAKYAGIDRLTPILPPVAPSGSTPVQLRAHRQFSQITKGLSHHGRRALGVMTPRRRGSRSSSESD